MKLSRWTLIRYFITRAARRQGFLDPIELLTRLRSFAQPSEVGEPIELLRAGVVFHARGLINSRVIQYNLDWVWPYWVERQYDPHDQAFVPRAFSVSHINLTHRNWTAIGHPDCEQYPLVDPRGLVTPLFDGWSLDGWIFTENGRCLLPSQAPEADQYQELDNGLAVTTHSENGGLKLTTTASVEVEHGKPICVLTLIAHADSPAWLVVALRPQNSEGISFVNDLSLASDRESWSVDDTHTVAFSAPTDRNAISDYENGDISLKLRDQAEFQRIGLQQAGRCDRGMVTGAALFAIPDSGERTITARIELPHESPELEPDAWPRLRNSVCQLRCPETRYQSLYDAAISSLILHSPGDVYPGPSTYKRFWFRDAAFIIHALLAVGLHDRAERALERFPDRQTPLGYFRSQEGEWDSNGQVLWILNRYRELSGRELAPEWHAAIVRGARWIIRKRLSSEPATPHAGLLPPGFSAEHLGPNDYYYWDDFWGIAGLQCASQLLCDDDSTVADEFDAAGRNFSESVDSSLRSCAGRLGRPAMPAAPYRRLDSGAIGSLAAGYPLQLFEPGDPRLIDAVDFLLENCFVNGAFFQDMIHSGLNAYLTLHVAQVLLRADDPRYLQLIDAVVGLASPTGQWPEAIHPLTGGGCMGDGHHVWAAAEWVMIVHNCFVREEADRLILCAGIPERWLAADSTIVFGPASTRFGRLTIKIDPPTDTGVEVNIERDWHAAAPVVEVRLPGFEIVRLERNATNVSLVRQGSPA